MSDPGQMTVTQAIQLGLQHQQAGRLVDAEKIYRRVLSQLPEEPNALHLLGVIALQTDRADEAVRLIGKSIEVFPANPAAFFSLANAHMVQRRFDEAIAAYIRATELRPDFAEAHANLGQAFFELGRLDEAMAAFLHAVQLNPSLLEAQLRIGNVLARQEKLDEAIASYTTLIRLKPELAAAHSNLGHVLTRQGKFNEAIAACSKAIRINPGFADAHYNLGNALNEAGRIDEAVKEYSKAIALRPDYFEAYQNMGNALCELKKFDDALAVHSKAVALKPDHPEALINLSNVFFDLGKFAEAEINCSRAISLQPSFAKAYINFGNILMAQRKVDEAGIAFAQAVRLDANFPEAHYSLGLVDLLRGKFLEGWKGYEWRWRCEETLSTDRGLAEPRWNGEELRGRTILLHADQGYGDAIMCARYAPLVGERGGRVIIECPGELSRLFRNNGNLGTIITRGERLPPFDLHCPLMSLPFVFDSQLDSIPSQVPYLNCDPELVAEWGERIGPAKDRLRVGLAWAGNPNFKDDHLRSMRLSQLAPLALVNSVIFYSLQKGSGASQTASPPPGLNLIDLGPQLNDFADTAAVMSHLDLIITTDTSVPHLAGALGKPVWLMLGFVPDWRWLLDRYDSPWYPAMRLFRQRTWGDWNDVVERVAKELQSRV